MSKQPSKQLQMPSPEQLLCENWLNTYSRESGQFDIRLHPKDKTNDEYISPITPLEKHCTIDQTLLCSLLAEQGIADKFLAGVHFLKQELSIISPLQHYSLGGYHRYSGQYFIFRWATKAISALIEPESLAQIISAEMGFLATPNEAQIAQQQQDELYQRMLNGLDNVRYFFAHASKEKSPTLTPLVSAEQQLKLGHPFHVVAKASSGFEKWDIDHYAPEMGTSFNLHFFAIEPTLLDDRRLTDTTQIHNRQLFNEAQQLIPAAYAHYSLLPLHPWQAKFLLANDEIKQLQQQNLLVALGAAGPSVWPSSSVRTVWVPEDRSFLKLALNVRITNFLRNNPLEHGQRALDVSRALHALPINLWRSESFYVVLEEAYQVLKTPDASLQAATLVIQRQSMCDEYADKAQVLSTLLEPQADSNEIPLWQLLRASASHHQQALDSQLIDLWWERYLHLSLVPLVRLFSESGISLEGHLQNSLLACENGWPKRFYTRDMEGASIDRERYFTRADACIDAHSPALYASDEAWFRFKYYVLVNHINHFIACLARSGLTTETRLWSLLDLVLGEVLLDESDDSPVRHWINDARSSETLPSKMNLASCFAQRGETPSWCEIPNPLFKAHRQKHIANRQTEASYHSSIQLLNSQSYHLAQRRVIQQTLEALLYEKVIQPSSWVNNCLTLKAQCHAHNQQKEVFYQCQATLTESFDRIRLLSDEVLRVSSVNEKTTVTSIDAMLDELTLGVDVPPERWQTFIQELLHTTIKHAQSLQCADNFLLRGASTDRIEARLSDGHPYHPGFKSRMGFNVDDNQRFSPELSNGIRPILLAARKSLCHFSLAEDLSVDALIKGEGWFHWHEQLKALGLSAEEYLPLPVHPWQWTQVILPLYQEALSQQDLLPLDLLKDVYLPQQSIRTLSNTAQPHNCYLKLSMSLLNTSTKRLLPAHTIANAAPISDYLSRIVKHDQLLPESHKPLLLKEVAAIGFAPKHPHMEYQGALACIWRLSAQHVNHERKTSIVPLQALTTVDADGRPFIDDWIAQHGLDNWLKALIQRAYIPVLHLLWAHGLALESHAQNMGLAHRNGMPQRAVLKDFHDGLRFNRQWLSDSSLLDKVTEAPASHRRINPNSYLEENDSESLRDFVYDALFFVNLAELAWLLACQYGMSEAKFWEIVSAQILDYQATHLSLTTRFALLDIFAEEVNIEKLASRRFSDSSDIYLRVANPLHKARKRMQSKLDKCSEVHAND